MIIRRNYDHIEDQRKIGNISSILQWLDDKGFSIIYYERPIGNNKLYPDLELIARRRKSLSKREVTEFQELEGYGCYYPFNQRIKEELDYKFPRFPMNFVRWLRSCRGRFRRRNWTPEDYTEYFKNLGENY
jgi:hypothetical protein